MDRRGFLKATIAGTLGTGGVVFVEGCKSPSASEKTSDGQPWRCESCGHITVLDMDITGLRCPRCAKRRLVRISEKELRKYRKSEPASRQP